VENNLPYYDAIGSSGVRIVKFITRNLCNVIAVYAVIMLIVSLYFEAIGKDFHLSINWGIILFIIPMLLIGLFKLLY